MRIHLRILLFITTGLLLFSSQVLSAKSSSDRRIKPFQAEYHVSLRGIPAAKIDVSLELDINGGYRYRQHSVPMGLLALFRKDEITEVSEGVIRENRVIPSSYLYKRERSKKPKQVKLLFDWNSGRVSGRERESDWSLSIPAGAQDKFSKQLAMMVAMNSAQHAVSFKVADDERLKTYHFRPQGVEAVKTERKEYQALKIVRSKEGRPSKSTLWLAPDLHFLPIKVEKTEQGNRYVMELVSVQWLEPGPGQQPQISTAD
jgi:hypothetical protein